MFESEDFAWVSSRMPVTIRHLYNSALSGYQYNGNSGIQLNAADFSAMKLGYGWKLNIMQSMTQVDSGYVHVGENGEETYFKRNGSVYEAVDDSEVIFTPATGELTMGSEVHRFDSAGRLINITDAYDNSMNITYSSGRIATVTDGAGRVFAFGYNTSGFLTSILAPDCTQITYTYSGNLLRSVIYPDGTQAIISYASNKPVSVVVQDADDNAVIRWRTPLTATGWPP